MSLWDGCHLTCNDTTCLTTVNHDNIRLMMCLDERWNILAYKSPAACEIHLEYRQCMSSLKHVIIQAKFNFQQRKRKSLKQRRLYFHQPSSLVTIHPSGESKEKFGFDESRELVWSWSWSCGGLSYEISSLSDDGKIFTSDWTVQADELVIKKASWGHFYMTGLNNSDAID